MKPLILLLAMALLIVAIITLYQNMPTENRASVSSDFKTLTVEYYLSNNDSQITTAEARAYIDRIDYEIILYSKNKTISPEQKMQICKKLLAIKRKWENQVDVSPIICGYTKDLPNNVIKTRFTKMQLLY